MATITRGTKSTSNPNSTSFANNTDPTAAEINTDLNTIYTEINGALSEDNLGDSAIDFSGNKLSGILATSKGGTGTPVGVRLLIPVFRINPITAGFTYVFGVRKNKEDTALYLEIPQTPTAGVYKVVGTSVEFSAGDQLSFARTIRNC